MSSPKHIPTGEINIIIGEQTAAVDLVPDITAYRYIHKHLTEHFLTLENAFLVQYEIVHSAVVAVEHVSVVALCNIRAVSLGCVVKYRDI